MRNPDGYVTITYPDDPKLCREIDTWFCAHCGRHTHVKVGDGPEFTCKICMGPICGVCANALPHTGCKPHEQMLAEMEGAINKRVGSTVPGWMLKSAARAVK